MKTMTCQITHRKNECIGCRACAAIAPEFWEMDEEGLSHLKGSSVNAECHEILVIPDTDSASNQEAAEACPVQIISVKKKERVSKSLLVL